MTYWAGGFFYNPKTNSVLLHERDAQAPVNPNKWGFFGGGEDLGDTTPIATFLREIKEELGLEIREQDVKPFVDYFNTKRGIHRYVFIVESDLPTSAMTLGEGKGLAWIPLERVFDYDLTDKTIVDLQTFVERRQTTS